MNKEEGECLDILKNVFVRDCLLSGNPWKYFACSVPLHVFEKGEKGDVDILVRLVGYSSSHDSIFPIVRAIEVKTFKVSKLDIKPSRINEDKKTFRQIEKLNKLGFKWCYLLDVFIFEDYDMSGEALKMIESKIQERQTIATKNNFGYLALVKNKNGEYIYFVNEISKAPQPLLNIGTKKLISGKTIIRNSTAEKIIKVLDELKKDSDLIIFNKPKKIFESVKYIPTFF